MSQVSLGRPEFVPGTPLGHPTAKFLYVIFLYRFFSLHIDVDRLLCHTDPHCMAYFGGIFFANMGGWAGVVRLVVVDSWMSDAHGTTPDSPYSLN